MLASVNLKEVKMRAIHVTNEELYEFVKLYEPAYTGWAGGYLYMR